MRDAIESPTLEPEQVTAADSGNEEEDLVTTTGVGDTL